MQIKERDHEPLLFCFCGPSGCGKSTICSQLVHMVPELALSISTTTRAPRQSEVDGVHYNFVSRVEFDERVVRGGFLEHAEYNGNLYGTEYLAVQQALDRGTDLLLDIDVQGVQQLKDIYDSRCVAIFVHPPSRAELVRRITSRGAESELIWEQRLRLADREVVDLLKPGFSQYLLINDVLGVSLKKAESIVVAERMRMSHQTDVQISKVLLTA